MYTLKLLSTTGYPGLKDKVCFLFLFKPHPPLLVLYSHSITIPIILNSLGVKKGLISFCYFLLVGRWELFPSIAPTQAVTVRLLRTTAVIWEAGTHIQRQQCPPVLLQSAFWDDCQTLHNKGRKKLVWTVISQSRRMSSNSTQCMDREQQQTKKENQSPWNHHHHQI